MTQPSEEQARAYQNLLWYETGPEVFQDICRDYLFDKGLQPLRGPRQGCDDGHDIYGEAYTGHCSLTLTKSKILHDVKTGILARKEAKLPPARTIFCFGARVEKHSRIALEDHASDARDLAVQHDDRYQANPPDVCIVPSYEIVDFALTNANSRTFEVLEERRKQGLRLATDEDALADWELTLSHGYAFELFCKDIQAYQATDTPADDLAERIISNAWRLIVYNRDYAAILLDSILPATHSPINDVLEPLCKTALGVALTESDLGRLFEEAFKARGKGDLSRAYALLVSRLIRNLIYAGAELVDSPSVMRELLSLAQRSPLGHTFCADLMLRHVCGLLVLPKDVFRLLEKEWDAYRMHPLNEQAPLILLSDFLLKPVEMAKSMTLPEAAETLSQCAELCESPLEATWCVYALLRVLPLYSASQDNLDYAKYVSSLTDRIPGPVLNRTPHLVYMRLSYYLKSYMRDGDYEDLANYERYFRGYDRILLAPQRYTLQTEYAANLYFALQSGDLPHIQNKLQTVTRLCLGVNIKQINYLTNRLIERHTELDTPVDAGWSDHQKQSHLLKVLHTYIKAMYREHVTFAIKENWQKAFAFRASCNIADIRSGIASHVLNGLERNLPRLKSNATICARASAAFRLIPRNDQTAPMMLDLIRCALAAGEYEVARCAVSLSYGLYACWHYAKDIRPSTTEAIEEMSKQLASIIHIGEQGIPTNSWVWYVGLDDTVLHSELPFMRDLARSADPTGVLDQDWVTGISFSTVDLAALRQHRANGSLLASVVGDNTLDAEVWNAIGTLLWDAIQNGSLDLNPETMRMGALYYRWAMFYSKGSPAGRSMASMKYRYNAYHSWSTYYLAAKIRPPEEFFSDVAHYVGRFEHVNFAWHSERLEPFAELLSHYLADLEPGTKKDISKAFRRDGWMYRRLETLRSPLVRR